MISFINANAVEFSKSTSNNRVLSDCVTVTFDKIHLTDEGMFVDSDYGLIPIIALYSDGNQYRCDIHNRLEDLITCPSCGMIYDRHQYKICPNRGCTTSRGAKH